MNIQTTELLNAIRERALLFAAKPRATTSTRDEWTDVTGADGMVLANLVRGKQITLLADGGRMFARPAHSRSTVKPMRHIHTTGGRSSGKTFGQQKARQVMVDVTCSADTEDKALPADWAPWMDDARYIDQCKASVS